MTHAPISALYERTVRDAQSASWGPFFAQVGQSAAVAAFGIGAPGTSTEVVIPPGFALFVDGALAVADAGAGQTADELYLSVVDSANNELTRLAFQATAGAAGAKIVTEASDFLLLEGNHYIVASGTFSAGGVANRLDLYLNGLIMPRGNAVLF